MVKKKIDEPKGEKRLPNIEIELDLYRTQKSLQKPENQSLIILSKLSTQA